MPCVVSTACATQDGATEGIAVAVGVADKYVPVRERHIQRRVCAALLPRSRWCHCVRRRGWNAARTTTTAAFRELAATYGPLCCSSVGGGGPAARACTVGVTGCWCGGAAHRQVPWLCACVCVRVGAASQKSLGAGAGVSGGASAGAGSARHLDDDGTTHETNFGPATLVAFATRPVWAVANGRSIDKTLHARLFVCVVPVSCRWYARRHGCTAEVLRTQVRGRVP